MSIAVFNHLGLRNGIGHTTLRTMTLAVVCITCMQASAQKKLLWSNLDLAFISNEFMNWKVTTVKFAIHEASKCHKEVVSKMIALPSSTKNVAESLSNALKIEKFERQQWLLKVPYSGYNLRGAISANHQISPLEVIFTIVKFANQGMVCMARSNYAPAAY